jgi:hypothetical protein
VGSPSRKDQDFAAFDLWLLRRTCAVLGVQPASIGFVGEQYKVTQGESLAATTQFGAGPLLQWRKSLYDDLLRRRGYPELEARNVTPHETGAAARAARNEVRIRSGQCTPNEARAEEGLEPLPGGDTLFLAGGLVPLEQAATSYDPAAEATERALRSWEQRALNRLRMGRPATCDPVSNVLPPTCLEPVRRGLAECATLDEIRRLFRLLRYPGQPRDPDGKFAHGLMSQDESGGYGGSAKSALDFGYDVAEARWWAEQCFQEWAKRLDPEETEALMRYQNENFNDVNRKLRGAALRAGVDLKALERQIDAMDRAIGQGSAMHDVILYRRVQTQPYGASWEELAGGSYHDAGYSSTSLVESGAFQAPQKKRLQPPVIATIHVPKGTPMAYIDLISTSTKHRDQEEVLLPRGLRYHVHSVESRGDGETKVHMEIDHV